MAARMIGVGRRTLYKWRDSDDEFAGACHDASEDGIDVIEDVALKRAKDSSDRLLMFLLKARRPEKYRERGVYVYPDKYGRHPVKPTIEFVDRPTEDQDPMGWAAQASGRAADGEPRQPEPPSHGDEVCPF